GAPGPGGGPAPASSGGPVGGPGSGATAIAPGGPAPKADAGVTQPAPEPRIALRIELTAVEGVRFDLQVLSEAEASLFQARSKEGEGLSLRNIGVRATDRIVYVMLRSAWSGSGKESKRGYNAEKPYTLTVSKEEAGANAELEPNDELAKATPLPANGFREGFISPKGDVDYYVLKAEQPVLVKLHLSGVERLDLVLSVVEPTPDGKSERV